jgi:hypothetical protein
MILTIRMLIITILRIIRIKSTGGSGCEHPMDSGDKTNPDIASRSAKKAGSDRVADRAPCYK